MSSSPTEETVEATFAFVDLAGFTAVTEAHGDVEAVSIVRRFRDRALAVLGSGDELVKTIGDAVMLRFPTPQVAVVALRQLLQHELAVHDAALLPRAGAQPSSSSGRADASTSAASRASPASPPAPSGTSTATGLTRPEPSRLR